MNDLEFQLAHPMQLFYYTSKKNLFVDPTTNELVAEEEWVNRMTVICFRADSFLFQMSLSSL